MASLLKTNIMLQKITIPKPCNENWDKFTPTEKGKHCQVCAKTVIDFTNWQPTAIVNYIATNKEEETCGRFRLEQLEITIPTATEFAKQISYFRISTLKKVAAIFLFAFIIQSNSYAAEATIHGGTTLYPSPKIEFNLQPVVFKKDKPKKKTTKKEIIKKKNTKGKVKVVKVQEPEPMIMGKMVMPHN